MIAIDSVIGFVCHFFFFVSGQPRLCDRFWVGEKVSGPTNTPTHTLQERKSFHIANPHKIMCAHETSDGERIRICGYKARK